MDGAGVLVLCLDGADLGHFARSQGNADLPHLAKALAHARPLASTPVPQTPVAWTALLCGAPPSETGVWGWSRRSGTRFARYAAGDLPSRALDWGSIRVLLAGLPFLPADVPPADIRVRETTASVLGGLVGPTKRAGGSRPHIPAGTDPADAERRWREHHRRWAAAVAAAAEHTELALVHCDSVDWFSHRFGPADDAGRIGWRLADEFLGEVTRRLSPRRTLVVSDHGSAPVRCFVRLHEALYRRGLIAVGPAAGVPLERLMLEPVFCGSDYGALWICDETLVDPARELLMELGAVTVTEPRAAGTSNPRLVPSWPDGWLVLLPPELDPIGSAGLLVTEGAEFDRLRKQNWFGDHAHDGLLGSDDPLLFDRLKDCAIHEIKEALCGWAVT